jgi:hypothetical protein
VAVAGGWTVAGAQSLAAQFANGAARVEALVPVVVEKAATDLVALTQQNASHRPGPNAPTGDYRGSWEPRPVEDADPTATSWSAGTDRVQANRLEYGFVGTDALGRVYDQDPLPHHGPAVDVIDPIFELAMAEVIEQAVRW